MAASTPPRSRRAVPDRRAPQEAHRPERGDGDSRRDALRQARVAALRALDGAGRNPDAAARECDVAVSRLIPFGLTDALADVLRWSGMIRRDQGLFAEAEAFYNHSLAVATGAGYDIGRAHALSSLGGVAQLRGQLARAHELYSEAATLAAALEDQTVWACIHQNLGIVAGDQGRNEDAANHFRQALAVLDDARAENAAVVWLLNNLGVLHRREGLARRAAGELERARTLAIRLGDVRSEGVVEENLSAAYLALGDIDGAERAAVRAISIASQRHDALRLAAALHAVACVHHRQGRPTSETMPVLEKAASLVGGADDVSLLAEILVDLGDRYREAARLDDAEAAWSRARTMAEAGELRHVLDAVSARVRRHSPAKGLFRESLQGELE